MQRKWFGWMLWLGLIVGACTPGAAEGAYRPYSVRAEDAHGRGLRSFHHGGELFVLGRDGERYNLRVTNHTGRRVEAVLSVDGRDVISGQKGDYARQRGYVLGPYESLVVEGFRTSAHAVAAFRFTHPEDSYSSRMGTPENVGVIGAAFFPERTRPRRSAPKKAVEKRMHGRLQAPSPAPKAEARGSADGTAPRRSASSARRSRSGNYLGGQEGEADDRASASNIGTQYGEHRHSQVREVRFVRAHPGRPALLATLRYDDERGLVARGIRVRPRPSRRHPSPPEAFPMSQYAPPPPPARSY